MMKKYSKIGKLSTAVKNLVMQHQFEGLDEDGNAIYNKHKELPSNVNLYGTVKLHGTNAGVMQKGDGTLQFQSRENVITPEKDNAGFAFWANNNSAALTQIFFTLREKFKLHVEDEIVIYGEWAGKGIQKNVAVSELDKAFYIFDVAVLPKGDLEDNYYVCVLGSTSELENEEARIFNLWNKNRFPTYHLTMDLNEPAMVQNDIVGITEEVEKQCPVGEHFGVEGIGEGCVWRTLDRAFLTKIKGTKHAGKSKVRKTNSVDLVKMNSVKEFVDEFVDEERLEQGWQKMEELGHGHEPKACGHFVRWMINDILSEESDTLGESGLEPKDVNPSIGKKSSSYFMKRLDEI